MKNSGTHEGPEACDGFARILVGGMLGLAIAMGIGRFAYTPILPAMEAEAGLKHFLAGEIASWNYLGYLVGTLVFSHLTRRLSFRVIYPAALAGSCLSTAAMAMSDIPWCWGVLRFIGGVASCIIFISIASQVMALLAQKGRPILTSVLYSGVGIGIAFTGAVTPFFQGAGGWRGCWAGIGACACCLSALSLFLVMKIKGAGWQGQAAPVRASKRGNGLLIGAYFLEGLGYIVTATFLVAIVKETPGMAPYAPLSWVIVGLSAAISPLLWQAVSARVGIRTALAAAYVVQALGMCASLYLTGVTGLLLSAATFGGTFMGITSLTLDCGARRERGRGNLVAVLTFAFALGQIIGPPCAGGLAQASSGFALALKIAAACVFVGGVMVWSDRGPGMSS